jgi:hypothetical protein
VKFHYGRRCVFCNSLYDTMRVQRFEAELSRRCCV